MTVSLPRRTFLKGLGGSIALPWLEIMRPSTSLAAAENAVAPKRMAFVFFPNGAIMESWKPQEAGPDYTLSKTLEPLADLKDDLVVFTGLAQDEGRAKGDGPGDHARCAATFLTGAHPVKTGGADIQAGVSVDQVAAQHIGKKTILPSLELGIDRGRNAGQCDSGYSCAYSSNVSWKTPNTPMAKEVHPRLVFERLFGSEKDRKNRLRRLLYRKSILDLAAADAKRLKSQLGQTDRRKIEEYFTAVRELEERIVKSEKQAERKPPEFDVPQEIPSDHQEHVRLMYDVMVLAFQTDTTRISTFMLGNAGSNHSYPMVDVNDGWHHLSHHGNDEEKIAKIQKIDQFLVTEFARFLKSLKSIREGERTLLDNSMILYGSGLSDANRHWHHDLPILLAGRGGGTIQTGHHIKCEDETPMNNLFLSLLDRIGADVKKIGDSSGRLTALDA